MQRALEKHLNAWKKHPLRKPLVLRGARQVGKSYLVQQFGKQFDNLVTVNFERDPKAKALFESSKNAAQLLSSLTAYTNQPIVPSKTLLFLDEVQFCEQALLSLRYFKEELPALHVIAAGSLLEFALESVGIPVGRVQFLYLHPLSFGEYLDAMGKAPLHQQLLQQPLDAPLHETALEQLKQYCWLGGMPAVVDAWRQHQNPLYCQEIQDQLLLSYRQDFEKYAKKHQVPLVGKLFDGVAAQLGAKFKYSTVDNMLRSGALKAALELLVKAGIVHLAHHTSAQGLPLAAGSDSQKFKAFFLDIGLLQRIKGVNLKDWLLAPLEITYMGTLAEQWVAQEYIAHTAINTPTDLFYWHREAKSSNAEVDFVFQQQQQIVPVEVKASHKGRLTSLALFLESHPHSHEGLVISQRQEWQLHHIKGIPFYALERWLK
jgi:predicted AAA+ superfamily ATPase